MEDFKIIELYLKRNETALLETQNKYSKYLSSISYNILRSRQDAEECVSDTYKKAWDTIPPQNPQNLATYLGKIARNLSISRLFYNNAQKRDKRTELLFSEVEEMLPSSDGDITDEIALKELLNIFLARLEKTERVIFVRRYYYASSIKEIADSYGLNKNSVKVTLFRLRQKLKEYLQSEGVSI
ncbi:MAG: sigma-70 family RNA polymerase sigma factor [Clostridia bacterium]|nr:sigma-70 family RNA polymerase sigma factor [Clostridia bacterium]